MKSFLSQIAAWDFTKTEFHHFRTALKAFQTAILAVSKLADKREKGQLN